MNLAITGATSGIGAETVKALAPKFSKIFLLVRNREKAASLTASLNTTYPNVKFYTVHCDLADLQTVTKAAAFIKGECKNLHVLINNAGGIFQDRILTKDNLEMTFSTNHLGHFLLTQKLIPLLEHAVSARIINVSSEAHRAATPDFEDLQMEHTYQSFRAYANAKLYNILFTKSLAEKYEKKDIYAYALHPGLVDTNFANQTTGIFKWLIALAKPFMISAVKGAQTGIYLASHPNLPGKNGSYFKKSKIANPSRLARSKKMQDKLWHISEDLIKEL